MFNHNKKNYLIISDNIMLSYSDYLFKSLDNIHEYNPYFTNYSVSLINQDIYNNRTIRVNNYDYYFKKELRESNYVIISVGMEEIGYNYDKYDMKDNYNYFNKMYLDIEKLIMEVKKYAKEKIIFLGYYNPSNYYDANTDEFFYSMNNKLDTLMSNNNIIYIDLYELIKGNNYLKENGYLNNIGNNAIVNIIKLYL